MPLSKDRSPSVPPCHHIRLYGVTRYRNFAGSFGKAHWTNTLAVSLR